MYKILYITALYSFKNYYQNSSEDYCVSGALYCEVAGEKVASSS